VYELVAEVSLIMRESDIKDVQNGVRSSAVRFSFTSFVPTDRTRSWEKGKASARTDSRLIITTLRIGCFRNARGGLARSTGGAEICWAT